MQNIRVQSWFFSGLLALVIVLNILVFLPYFNTLFLALTTAVIFKPMYKWILSYVKKPGWAALLSVFSVLLIIILPLVIYGTQLLIEAENFYEFARSEAGSAAMYETINRMLGPFSGVADNITNNIRQYAQQGAGAVAQNLGAVFASIAGIVFKFILLIFALFFLWKDGTSLRKAVHKISPLNDEVDQAIMDRIEIAMNSVVRGQLTIAVIQGLITITGFALFGIPNAFLWGSMAIVAALIPSVGTALIITPAIIYQFITGDVFGGVGLLLWGVFAVGLIDNVLAPILITRNIKMHPFIILLSVLGGVVVFGPIGFLMGPLLVATLLALVDVRNLVYKQ